MANQGLVKKEIRAGRIKLLTALAVMVMTAVSLPFLHSYTLKIMQAAPIPEFAKGQVAMLNDYRFWIWSQWFGKNLVQTGSIAAVIFGAGMISSEVSRKTIHFVLAGPIRRQDVFTTKYIVNLSILILATIVSTVVLYVTVIATGQNYPIGQFISHTVVAVSGLSVVFSIAAFFSTMFDQTLKCMMISLVSAFVLSLPGYIPKLAQLSLYYQMSGVDIFNGKGFPVISTAVMITLAVALYVCGRNRFVRRDL